LFATPPEYPLTFAPNAASLSLATMAMHEYLGYAVYWAMGYL
jgi:hypothetical protein